MPRKKKHEKHATEMQLTAFKLHSQGLSRTEAGRKAGYSAATLKNPGKNIFTSQAITSAVDRFKLELKDLDLTTEYIGIKLKELLEASKLSNKDYTIQLKALEMLKQILVDSEIKKEQPNIARSITLTEYLEPLKTTTIAEVIETIPEVEPTQESTQEQPHILD